MVVDVRESAPGMPADAPIQRLWRRLGRLRPIEWIAVLLLSPAYGMFAVIAPSSVHRPVRTYDDWMFSLLWNSVRSLWVLPTLGLLIVGGFLFEKLWRGLGVMAGVTVMSAFGLGALVGGTVEPGTHNLIPFELAQYVSLSLVFVAGALVPQFIERRRTRMPKRPT